MTKKRYIFSQRIVLVLFFSLVLISCGTSLHSSLKDIELDMRKQDVITKLGNDYDVISMVKTNRGNLEILRYTTYIMQNDKMTPANYYFLHFLDGVLVEMVQEDAIRSLNENLPHPHPHPRK